MDSSGSMASSMLGSQLTLFSVTGGHQHGDPTIDERF